MWRKKSLRSVKLFDLERAGRHRHKEAPGDNAADDSDTEIDGGTGKGHQVLQALTERRHEGEGGERHRIELVGGQNAGDDPAGDNGQADDQAGGDVGWAAAEGSILEAEDQECGRD